MGEECFLPLPDFVLRELGWKVGDILVLDIPTVYPSQIIIYREADGEPK